MSNDRNPYSAGGYVNGDQTGDTIPAYLERGYILPAKTFDEVGYRFTGEQVREIGVKNLKTLEDSVAAKRQEALDTKLSILHNELSHLYRNDPRATVRIGKIWFQIDVLEDAKRVRGRG